MGHDIQFIKSAVLPKDYPVVTKVEVAVTGRSNAGKSSFINALSRSVVAKVSSEPGKTRVLNFFDVRSSDYILVDTPGYGFASRRSGELKMWKKMVETYLAGRENLIGLVLLMDVRRAWQEEEELLVQFLESVNLPVLVVLTKADKLKKDELKKKLNEIQQDARIEKVFSVSALKKQGLNEVEEYIYKEWVQKASQG